jgi:glycosidase
MSQPLNNRLLLNRQTLHQIKLAGQEPLAKGVPDLKVARDFALWHQGSGAELYLFALITAATREIARSYLEQLRIQADLDKVVPDDSTQLMREFEAACTAFLHCYPTAAWSEALAPGAGNAARAPRWQLLAELFVLEALVRNPAAQPFRDLFDDEELLSQIDYHALTAQLTNLTRPFQAQLDWKQGLPELLRAPISAAPDDLSEQASFIVQQWSHWLPEEIITELQLARAVINEENRPHLPGPGPSPQPLFGAGDGSDAPAAFTADCDWMSSAVLLAKSIYVWLDQLSTRYQRTITTLYDIPDEELTQLASWGFNALWLIGIWERSRASKRIKQLCGNPEAEASAYALHAYRVAEELGGDAALRDFEQRCYHHGIRLACDVVPNHTGIDSEWIQQHPEWFLQTNQPPYPAYRFSGPDLCDDAGTSIRIEDGYWDHSDAAVVCEHHNHQSGQRRYIYHGNDGTHMPWNDTAQLNFLLPEVRQAMSDLIVAVAQRFRLIRFDAAMTLARKHFRRLWFPPPGGSAGVPSRSTCWMSDADFEQAFPVEFWREVVDRINREAPDTLLIAEAFWLMESYFVRNLGMHRVYNSAFMNMLKREENAKYRTIIKDVLAYNPEILKRYVNFMNNPDEATAVEQFGKGDKYFGVATLLATLPGLPMFGHGQIEGYREKYGMEYRRAYWQEEPDGGFVAHHEQQVFPLLRIRHLFADVKNFSLFDFSTGQGVDENVYAFCNGPTGEKMLIVYNNAAQQTRGRLHRAAPKAAPEAEGQPQQMPVLNKELGLTVEQGAFCRYRDLRGSEYLQKTSSLSQGLELCLNAYEHQVFYDFRQIGDPDSSWHKLHQQLQGRAVNDLDRERLKICHQPLWQAFTSLLDYQRLHALTGGLVASPLSEPIRDLIKELTNEFMLLIDELPPLTEPSDKHRNSNELGETLANLPCRVTNLASASLPEKLLADLWYGARQQDALGVPLLGWLLLKQLAATFDISGVQLVELLWSLGLHYAWQESSSSPEQRRAVCLVPLLLETATQTPHPATCDAAFAKLCTTPDNAGLLGINMHANETWFLQEGMTTLAGGVALQAAITALREKSTTAATEETLSGIAEVLRQRLARAAAVGYRLDKFLSLS